jgi:hypothetical protein
MKLLYASIRCWFSAENQPVTLSFDVAGDLHRLGDQVQHLLVNRLAVSRNEQQINRRASLLPHEQYGRHAPADATDRTRAVWQELARIHHSEEAFAVHDFAGERLPA